MQSLMLATHIKKLEQQHVHYLVKSPSLSITPFSIIDAENGL